MASKPLLLREIYFEDEVPERISCDSGRDIEHAIAIKLKKSPADNPMVVHFSVLQKEYQIVRHMICKCGKGQHAQVIAQMNLDHKGKSLDVLKLQCPDTKETWMVYFDVTDVKKYLPHTDK